MPNVVTRRPGWRRHVPALLALLAAAALVVALARPQRTVAAPQRAATVVLVNDVSGSMRAEDVDPDRLTAAQRSAKLFAKETPDNFRIGLVTFSDYAEQRVSPTTDRGAIESAPRVDAGRRRHGDGRRPRPRARGRADPGARPRTARGRASCPRSSCCSPTARTRVGVNDPLEVARQAAAAKVPVYAIALGTDSGEVVQRDPFGFEQRIPVPPDKETLKRIAQLTGGRFFEAPSADDAEAIYERIGTRLTSKPEKREVTVAFAGGAFVLLLAGGALGLGWFSRPI